MLLCVAFFIFAFNAPALSREVTKRRRKYLFESEDLSESERPELVEGLPYTIK